jgi:hypothetical protein
VRSPRAVGARSLGGEAPDGGAQRSPVATAAVCCCSGDGAQCRENKRRHTPLGFLESRLGRLGTLEKDGVASSPAAARMARQAAVTARGGARHVA